MESTIKWYDPAICLKCPTTPPVGNVCLIENKGKIKRNRNRKRKSNKIFFVCLLRGEATKKIKNNNKLKIILRNQGEKKYFALYYFYPTIIS